MNTIIAVNWARNTATVSFTDFEGVGYMFSIGAVIILSGAMVRICCVMFKWYGFALSRMGFEESIGDIDYYRSSRVER